MAKSIEDILTLGEIVLKAHANAPPEAWDYMVGGSETETTLRRKDAPTPGETCAAVACGPSAGPAPRWPVFCRRPLGIGARPLLPCEGNPSGQLFFRHT